MEKIAPPGFESKPPAGFASSNLSNSMDLKYKSRKLQLLLLHKSWLAYAQFLEELTLSKDNDSPSRIRTWVTGAKGLYPRPLD